MDFFVLGGGINYGVSNYLFLAIHIIIVIILNHYLTHAEILQEQMNEPIPSITYERLTLFLAMKSSLKKSVQDISRQDMSRVFSSPVMTECTI